MPMKNMINPLLKRSKGEKIPISIGTAIALECLFGINTEKPLNKGGKPPYLKFDCLVINTRTLIRNIVSSIPSNESNTITKEHILEVLVAEMRLINEVVKDLSKGSVFTTFYFSDYARLKSVLKQVNLKNAYTPKQKENIDREVSVSLMLQSHSIWNELSTNTTNLGTNKGKRHNLFLTHYSVDLLLHPFNEVHLLESHTGVIKDSSKFNSKLKNAPDNCPFNKYTIQVYGDSSGFIQVLDTNLKRAYTKALQELPINPAMDEKRFYKLMSNVKEKEIKTFLSRTK